jgi:hypothetical protein
VNEPQEAVVLDVDDIEANFDNINRLFD